MREAGWYVSLAQTPAHNLKRFFIVDFFSAHMVTLSDTSHTHAYTHTHTSTTHTPSRHTNDFNLHRNLIMSTKTHSPSATGTHTQPLLLPVVAAWETL